MPLTVLVFRNSFLTATLFENSFCHERVKYKVNGHGWKRTLLSGGEQSMGMKLDGPNNWNFRFIYKTKRSKTTWRGQPAIVPETKKWTRNLKTSLLYGIITYKRLDSFSTGFRCYSRILIMEYCTWPKIFLPTALVNTNNWPI